MAGKEINNYKEIFNKYGLAELSKIELETAVKETNQALIGDIKAPLFKVETMLSINELLFAASTAYFDRSTDLRWEKTLTALAGLEKSIDDWYKQFEAIDELRAQGEAIKGQFGYYSGHMQRYYTEVVKQQGYNPLLAAHQDKLNNIFANLGNITSEKMKSV